MGENDTLHVLPQKPYAIPRHISMYPIYGSSPPPGGGGLNQVLLNVKRFMFMMVNASTRLHQAHFSDMPLKANISNKHAGLKNLNGQEAGQLTI